MAIFVSYCPLISLARVLRPSIVLARHTRNTTPCQLPLTSRDPYSLDAHTNEVDLFKVEVKSCLAADARNLVIECRTRRRVSRSEWKTTRLFYLPQSPFPFSTSPRSSLLCRLGPRLLSLQQAITSHFYRNNHHYISP